MLQFYLAWVAETLIIHTSVQSVLILRLFLTQGTVSKWRERLKWKLVLLCPVQVLAQLDYCRSKQVKSINSWTVTPLLIIDVNRQSKGARGHLSFILAVGKNRFLFWLEVLRKLIHSLCGRYIINIFLKVNHTSVVVQSQRYFHFYDKWYML